MDITVKVKIGSVEVDLTLEDAAELHAALGRVCGRYDAIPVVVPAPYPVPYPVPYRERWQYPYVITCGTSGITLTATSSSSSGTFDNGTITGGRALVWSGADGRLHSGDKVVMP